MSIFSAVILPILGIIIVIFCASSFIFPYGEKLRDRIQKINAFGVNLEISVITIFIIIGIVMAYTGIFLYVRDYETQLSQTRKGYETQLSEIRKDYETLRATLRADYTIIVRLPSVDKNRMQSQQLEGRFILYDGTRHETDPPFVDSKPGEYRITFKDIPKNLRVRELVLTERTTQKSWFKADFTPSQPEFDLIAKE